MKAIKARSDKLEECAKKQNEYQERRLSKYILGIERVQWTVGSFPDSGRSFQTTKDLTANIKRFHFPN